MPKIVKDEEIYQAVVQVISERGYAGATTKQMAEAANVSEVTLFRKYENKQQLIQQAITFLVSQADFEAATQYTGDMAADLLRVVQAYQESAVQNGQFIFVLLAEMQRYVELADLLDVPLHIFSRMGDLLVRYQAEGQLRPENPMHTLTALLGPLIYVDMLHKAMGDEVIPPLNLELHVTHFLKGRCPL